MRQQRQEAYSTAENNRIKVTDIGEFIRNKSCEQGSRILEEGFSIANSYDFYVHWNVFPIISCLKLLSKYLAKK